MPPHPLKNFEIQKYYKMNLDLMVFILEIICLKKKDGADVIIMMNIQIMAYTGLDCFIL